MLVSSWYMRHVRVNMWTLKRQIRQYWENEGRNMGGEMKLKVFPLVSSEMNCV